MPLPLFIRCLFRWTAVLLGVSLVVGGAATSWLLAGEVRSAGVRSDGAAAITPAPIGDSGSDFWVEQKLSESSDWEDSDPPEDAEIPDAVATATTWLSLHGGSWRVCSLPGVLARSCREPVVQVFRPPDC